MRKGVLCLKNKSESFCLQFSHSGNGTLGSAESLLRCGKQSFFPPCMTYLIQEALPDHILSTKLIVFGIRNVFSGSQAGRCLTPFFLCVFRAHMSPKGSRVYFITSISHSEMLLKSHVFVLSDCSM